jgi:hypothetical protein
MAAVAQQEAGQSLTRLTQGAHRRPPPHFHS